MVISRYHHPIWTMIASTIFVAIGGGALWGGMPIISAALVFYGAGIGIESIAGAHYHWRCSARIGMRQL
jgi:hypothetical protein